jgi:hypothetical protein
MYVVFKNSVLILKISLVLCYEEPTLSCSSDKRPLFILQIIRNRQVQSVRMKCSFLSLKQAMPIVSLLFLSNVSSLRAKGRIRTSNVRCICNILLFHNLKLFKNRTNRQQKPSLLVIISPAGSVLTILSPLRYKN